MSEYAKFFDSKDGDRKYSAEDFREWLRDLYPTGVMENGFFATANDDMTITIGAGFVNIGGSVKTFEEATLTIPAAGSSDRIDAVVIELNEEEKDIVIKYVTGTQTAPTPVRTDTIYQLIPAEITVKAGTTQITQKDVTDTRMVEDLCGYIVRLVDSYDFTTILEQYSDYTEQFIQDNFGEFDEWFQSMKHVFSNENIAAVNSLITSIQSRISGYQTDFGGYVDEAASLHNRFDAVISGGGGAQKFKRVTCPGYTAGSSDWVAEDITQDEWDKTVCIFAEIEASFASRDSRYSQYNSATSQYRNKGYSDCVMIKKTGVNGAYGSANFIFLSEKEYNNASSGYDSSGVASATTLANGSSVAFASLNFRIYFQAVGTSGRLYVDPAYEMNIMEYLKPSNGGEYSKLFNLYNETYTSQKRYYQSSESATTCSKDTYSSPAATFVIKALIIGMKE